MSQRSKEILLYMLCVPIIASGVLYFIYHQRQFHWWLLIGPAIGTPLAIMAARRQQYWDDVRSRRESSEGTLEK